ncbi:hypothetical protein DLNHIDIE_00907 [Acidithiobacillus thiooxidans ATCC 19377]|uniref:Uncharacterized protein n=1 Tax=Acidithiobacillus thiooxidans ATCC 19377 TaxID=637390 RepID=A0A543Q3Y7_ACITH|nr:hypothetical protein [Acidithiobacillus thiooxidans]MDX5934832.1 hypothetical protein [Acidithiobacillus thiooxidans]TQN51043.1 hypothetical protein DLNHIDIE_00907 [Acidithiobacillus thiooxidans ATCC 19377]
MPFQEVSTCGKNPTSFAYKGDVRNGVLIRHSQVSYEVTHKVFEDLLAHFAGMTVPGGFSMTTPILGGIGEYLSQQRIQPINATTWIIYLRDPSVRKAYHLFLKWKCYYGSFLEFY